MFSTCLLLQWHLYEQTNDATAQPHKLSPQLAKAKQGKWEEPQRREYTPQVKYTVIVIIRIMYIIRDVVYLHA